MKKLLRIAIMLNLFFISITPINAEANYIDSPNLMNNDLNNTYINIDENNVTRAYPQQTREFKLEVKCKNGKHIVGVFVTYAYSDFNGNLIGVISSTGVHYRQSSTCSGSIVTTRASKEGNRELYAYTLIRCGSDGKEYVAHDVFRT